MYDDMSYTGQMPRLFVHKSGNSLGIALPHTLVREMDLGPGDELLVQIERIRPVATLAGRLRDRLKADEFTRLSNEGEELA